jgi:hypothetical protein
MKVSEEGLDDFIRIYKEEYGEDITRAEASEMTFRLFTLHELLSKHRPKEEEAAPTPPTDRREEPPKIGFLR